MKHNDSARIGSLSKWHTFHLTGEIEGRGGRYLNVFIYTCEYTSFDRGQVLRVVPSVAMELHLMPDKSFWA